MTNRSNNQQLTEVHCSSRNNETSRQHDNLGPNIRLTNEMIKEQERVFDPICQVFRDPRVEKHQRRAEANLKVDQLNMARDIQVLREQPFNIVTNDSKLNGVDEAADPITLTNPNKFNKVDDRTPPMPRENTYAQYNIISNHDYQKHHWAKPGDRPNFPNEAEKTRNVPAYLQKTDYNIVSNRYYQEHEDRAASEYLRNEEELNEKNRTKNRFNPIIQKFTDLTEEERMQKWTDAHRVATVERNQETKPPAIRDGITTAFNLINHEIHNESKLNAFDKAERSRSNRCKTKYLTEQRFQVEDIRNQEIYEDRRLNRVGVARYDVQLNRGFDIVTGDRFEGRGSKKVYLPYASKPPNIWDRVVNASHVQETNNSIERD